MAQDPSDAVTYRLSPRKAQDQLLWLVGGIVLVAAIFYFRGDGPQNGFDQIGLAFVAILVIWLVSDQYRKAKSDRSPQLVLDSEALCAPSLFASKVPWSAIRSYEIISTRQEPTVLELDVVNPERFGPVRTHPANWAGAVTSSTRFRLEVGELDASEAEIAAALRRFAPPREGD